MQAAMQQLSFSEVDSCPAMAWSDCLDGQVCFRPVAHSGALALALSPGGSGIRPPPVGLSPALSLLDTHRVKETARTGILCSVLCYCRLLVIARSIGRYGIACRGNSPMFGHARYASEATEKNQKEHGSLNLDRNPG
jgi:hypothetical protein